MKKAWVASMVCILALAAAVFADVPRVINYQGRLTDLNGNALPDGTYSIAIRLYDSDTAPESSAIWSDNYSVQTKNGYFNVMLGSNASFPLNLPFDRQYYLGIKVGIDTEMTPRQPLNSVPYALNVATTSLANVVLLTASSGTYVPSPGIKAIVVECLGGGGGGGGAASGASLIGVARGGRGGGYCRKYLNTLAANYSFVVGSGGNGGVAGNNQGQSGGDSTFGSILVAKGGEGGIGGVASTAPSMVSTGAVTITGTTGGDINIQGYSAGLAFSLSETNGIGGNGGSSPFGAGGMGGLNGSDGKDAMGYGNGGGGACAINSIDRAGGNGTQGIIVIWEFK